MLSPKLRQALLLCALVLIPAGAHAEHATTLDLTTAAEQNLWKVVNLPNIAVVPDGIRVQASAAGNLLRPLSVSHSIDVVEITYSSPTGGTFPIVWHGSTSQANEYYQLPIIFNPSNGLATLTVAMSSVGDWNGHPTTLGLGIPAGTDITIHSMTLRGWNAVEKAVESFRCFWAFDGIKSFSINFLWGPLLCSSPVAREHLFDQYPPVAHSGMRVVYVLLILGAVLITTGRLLSRDSAARKKILRNILLLFLALWVFLDLRMGAEFLVNWRHDYVMYLKEPAGKRVFRLLKFFPDFAAVTRPLLKDQPRYVLLTPTPVLFTGYIRYQTYPSIPVTPKNGSGASLWLVYERPDLLLDQTGRLLENNVPISPPGVITHEFMKGTFLFRVRP